MATSTTSLNPATRPSVASILPPLFLGTATFNTQHVKDPLQMPYRQIVSRALELGVNGFDTSPYYGPSEVLLGDALAAHTAATNIPRESYVLVTKAGRIAGDEFDYSPAYVRYSVLRSLNRLNTNYLDLVYMHDVEFVSPSEVLAAVQTLRQLRDEGKIRFVGISGFPVHVLCSLAEMIFAETGEPLDAILSYGHFTIQNPTLGFDEVVAGPDHTNDQSPLRRFRNAGVQVVLNASMLGMGLLTHSGIPTNSEQSEGKAGVIAKWHPAPDDLRTACKKLSTFANEAGERLETIALHWSMQEYARVGALAGLGVQLPGQGDLRVGGSVVGVTNVSELEQTVDAWKKVLEGMGASTETGSADKYEKLKALVEQKMWPALGEWKGYSWASPDEGFQNERSVEKMGTIPAEDELMKIVTRISSNLLIGRKLYPSSIPRNPSSEFLSSLNATLHVHARVYLFFTGRVPMAEAFGLVASIFATVQIADRVISLCKRYIESIRDAPSDLRTILVEVSAMKAVLESIKFLVKYDNEQPTISNSLRGKSGPVEGCLETMKSLEALFRAETAPPQGPGRSRKLKDQALVTLATLAWPLKESKARKLMHDLATYKSTIGLALVADTAHMMRDTAQKTTLIQEALSESQRYEVFKWLTDIDPSSLHHRAQKNYESDTVSDHLWKLFKHGGAPSPSSLLDAIAHTLEHFDMVYITIDAIDESKPREDLLKIIQNLATDARFQKLRLLLTSREYFDIEEVMIRFSTRISMKNSFLYADIRLYTASRLRKETRIKRWPTELQQEIVEALSQGANGMFRWVVCQIDVLRRIRMDAAKEALSRLPRTLNEAYDRIFEQIPEDDLLCVNFALKWLCFEVKVGRKSRLDMKTLAQAVGEDIGRHMPYRKDLCYNMETLREVCGCLIAVTPSTSATPDRFDISFAHYTVLEYLASNDRCNPDSFFALDVHSLVLERAEQVFRGALRVTDDDLVQAMADEDTDYICSSPSFGCYCAYTAIDLIIRFDLILSNQSAIFELVLDVLDATKSRFNPLFQIWGGRCESLDDPNPPNATSEIRWETIPDVQIGVLVRILLFGCVNMAEELLRRMDLHKCFQTRLDFRYEFRYASSDFAHHTLHWDWHFQGSLTDIFAVLFCAIDIDVFKVLIKLGAGAGATDSQGALIPFGPFHEHEDNCEDGCVLEELLSLGANPNVSGCYITPLQIAIASFDIDGVNALLKAGADPNAAGSTAGLPWPKGTAHFDFNILHGRQPLQICRQVCGNEMVTHFKRWEFVQGVSPFPQTVQSQMEAALLEHGATE
ncbi:L-galactose dehydrogenase [Colletotrichum camelliae]|nr:L-galactose dehydrogenase [Colletotrichum camelliae]